MLEGGIAGDALQLVGHDPFDILLNPVVVFLYHFLHVIHSVIVHEAGDNGYLPICLLLFGYFPGIDDNLAVEDFLLNPLPEIVGYGADEHPLCQPADLAGWNEAVHLGGYGGGNILPVDGDGVAFLKYLAEPLAESLGRFPHDLPRKDVANRVDDHLRLLVGIVTDKLAEILKTEQHGDLVAACGGYQVIQPLDENGGQLINDDGAFQPALLIDNLYNTAVVQAERSTIDRLPVGIVAYAEDFRLVGIVDVQRELVGRHHPIECRRNHTGQGNLRTGDLSHELVGGSRQPRIEERTEVVLQFGIGGHDGKDLLVRLVEELDGMGEGAIPAVLVHPQKPDDGGKENGGRLNEEIALLRRLRPVEIEHDAVRTLVSIGDVGHELRVEGIAAVAA